MSRETRRVLFYLFVVAFLILGSSIVLYSQGWRFNFKTDSFQRIGGIFLNSTPSDAVITLDGGSVQNQSSILQAGTLISDLIPGEHSLTLSEKGYLPWNKEVTVTSGGAAVFDKIILLPDGGSMNTASSVSEFALADSQPVTVENGQISFQNHIVRGTNLVAVSYGTKVITSNSSGIYYLTDLSSIGSSLNLNALFSDLRSSQLGLTTKFTINKIGFHPFDDSRVVINASDGLYIMDTANLTLDRVNPETVADFTTSYDNLLWTTDDGIWSYNLVLNSTTTVDNFATDTPITPYKINVSPSGSFISILDKSGELYLFAPGKQSPTMVGNDIYTSAFSPDSAYLAFASYNGLLSAYNINNAIYLNLGNNSNGLISNLEWYRDSAHLLTLQNGNLDFTEVATGTPINSDLISGNVTQFDYYSTNDTVYYIAPQGLFSFTVTR